MATLEERPWKDAIVGFGHEAPDQLLASPRNPKIHPKRQQDALAGAIGRVGWVDAVKVNSRTGHVLDGHARIGIAISRGEPTVPVLWLDVPESDEPFVLATFDQIGAMAVYDHQMLDDLLRDVQTDNPALDAMLDSLRREASDRLAAAGGPPDLDDLARTHGDPDDHDLWPFVRLQVPPEVYEQYKGLLAQAPGGEDHQQFAALLNAVDTAALDRAGA